MTEQAKVPAIRFAGFTDPWEQRKLGEIASFSKGSGYSKADIRESGIPLFLYGRMYTQYETRVDSVDTFAAPRPGTLYSKGTEIVVPASGESAEDIARASAITREGIALGGDLNVVYPQRMVTPLFLAYGLSHGSSQKLLAQKAQGKTVVHIHASDLKGLGIAFPDVTEQQAIGTFFSSLDDLITLHQRKYDKLVIFKKTMLEKMFPKDGESVPEIRFAGFTDPWEQRKLGELEKDATLYMGRGRVISAKDMSNTPGTFPVYSSSALDNGRMGAYGKYMFNQELITWSIDGGGAVFYRRKHRFSVTNVSGYIAVNPEKINCKFLAYAMSLAHSRIKFDYTVKAHPSVIRSLYTMGIPISLQEQQVIGSFFSRLDNLITLHQRKLELLRNIKKSLLDKMFV
ncbi:restriction endonuclease subunit S [Bifidobacterium bifidum]|uniref:restriction endonuclease subunit S n=1 Tax=Bifidobacterium bifidum TaxID=1681 RepID=UPI00232D7F98|nr:restriction endonuclease subunit S [Bifidobacterium bifidum]MDB1277929.1 restriction endonuclease subunit S [Bifidobacterium bifidum]